MKSHETIGELIVRLRMEKQKTQDEIADCSGVSRKPLGRCLARDLEPSPLVLKKKNPRDNTRGREGCQYLEELNTSHTQRLTRYEFNVNICHNIYKIREVPLGLWPRALCG